MTFRAWMGFFFFVMSLLMVTAAIPSLASACSCRPNSEWPSSGDIAGAGAVFAGRVTSIREIPIRGEGFFEHEVTFEVSEAFKGMFEASAVVYTTANSGLCGFGFRISEEYLVWAATGFGMSGRLTASSCSRTASMNDESAQRDLAWLQNGAGTGHGAFPIRGAKR